MGKREDIRAKRKKAQRQRMMTPILIVTGIVIVVMALIIFRSQVSIKSITLPEFNDYTMAEGNALGNPNAPVRIEEFADFQCSACLQFHEQTLSQIIDNYVATGQVYLVFRSFPVLDRPGSSESHDAANASYCAAEQNLFWEFHDVLFENRIGEGAGSFTTPRLLAMANKLGLDPTFEACLRENKYADQILAESSAAINAGFNSTPSFLINGQPLVGAYPFSEFVTLIEAALAETQPVSP
ncbi:MAG: DsbA family protein [Anaerolineales bacterium]|nr:MAG: DsbA family protein [Anaerolineales bacterium]